MDFLIFSFLSLNLAAQAMSAGDRGAFVGLELPLEPPLALPAAVAPPPSFLTTLKSNVIPRLASSGVGVLPSFRATLKSNLNPEPTPRGACG